MAYPVCFVLEGHVCRTVLESVFLALQASSRNHAPTPGSPTGFAPSALMKQLSFTHDSTPPKPSSVALKAALPACSEEAVTTPPAAGRSSQLGSPHLASVISLGSVNIDGLVRNPDSPVSDAAVGSPSPLPGTARWWNAEFAATPSSCLSGSSCFDSSNTSSRSNWSTPGGSVVSCAGSPASSSGSESEYVENWSTHFEDYPTPTPTPTQAQNPYMQGTPTLSPAKVLHLNPSCTPTSQVTALRIFWLCVQLHCTLLGPVFRIVCSCDCHVDSHAACSEDGVSNFTYRMDLKWCIVMYAPSAEQCKSKAHKALRFLMQDPQQCVYLSP